MESKKSIKRNLPIAGVCFIISSKSTSLNQNGTGEDCCQDIKIKKKQKNTLDTRIISNIQTIQT